MSDTGFLDREVAATEKVIDGFISARIQKLIDNSAETKYAILKNRGRLFLKFKQAAPDSHIVIKYLTGARLIIPNMPLLERGQITQNEKFQEYKNILEKTQGYTVKVIDTTPNTSAKKISAARITGVGLTLSTIPLEGLAGFMAGSVGLITLGFSAKEDWYEMFGPKIIHAKATLQIEKLEPEEPA